MRINYRIIFSFFILILGGLFIVISWKHYQINKIQNISEIYQYHIDRLNQDPTFFTLKSAEDFQQDNKKNIYGTLVSFMLANKYITNHNFPKASSSLQFKTCYSDKIIKNICSLRLARIQLYQGYIDKFINTVNQININSFSWAAIIEDLQGNAMIEKGNIKQALRFWHEAMKESTLPFMRYLIKMKIKYFSL
ncbi:MAG: tetratricopeptide repeat protein [Candidatus Dasytiphilus stammeri]